MSLSRNILATYASQIFVALAGIATLPLYVRYMGAESFGLVGFYAMLQASFQLLDMGLTATTVRQTASYCGGGLDTASLRGMLRALEKMYVFVAVLGAAAVVAGSGVIGQRWLKVQELPLEEVRLAVALMGVIIALRWMGGLYRGVITGFERLVWLGGFNSLFAAVRFVLVIPVLIWVGAAPSDFFGYQLIVALAELAALAAMAYRILPAVNRPVPSTSLASLKPLVRFAFSIGLTSSIWVLVTQTDKLVLSRLLPLSEYAFFTVAVLVASGVLAISAPLGGAIMPHLAKLHASGAEDELRASYCHSSQLVAVIALPAALVMALMSYELLWVWTGDADLAQRAAPVLQLYAVGNGVLALASFPYYLQFARGDMKLHLIGSALFVLVLVPGLIWATLTYGSMGAGLVWLTANLLYFFLWTPLVHRRLAAGLHSVWLLRHLAPVISLTLLGCWIAANVPIMPTSRWGSAVHVLVYAAVALGAAALGSSRVRHALVSKALRRPAGSAL